MRGGFLYVAAWMLTITLAARPAVANSIGQLEPPDDIWMISSRTATHASLLSDGAADDELHYWRDAGEAGWVAASRAEFLATGDVTRPTIFYVHGNRMSARDALPRGLKVFQRLFGGVDRHPVRFVIWSWPSAQIKGPVKDLRVKAHRSEVHAYHLARLVDQMNRDLPVGFVGYSYGARLISAAMHLLGGGEVVGRRLALRTDHEHRHMRAVFVAAAFDNDWLLPGHNHGNALTQLDRVLVVVNHQDPALRLYPLLKRGETPDALGFSGLPHNRHAGYIYGQVDQLNVTHSVGKAHALKEYIRAPKLVGTIGPFVTFVDAQPRHAADG